MNFTFLCLVIAQCAFLSGVYSLYNKDVLCRIDKGQDPVCEAVESPKRRSADLINNNIPSHDPFIPRTHSMFYNCTSLECQPVKLNSLMQITSPDLNLKACFVQTPGKFECEAIRYHHFKNVDKLMFLTKNIENKKFYLVDCLIYADRGRVCHKKEPTVDSHAKLVDTGTIARPTEPNVLSQDEFICEETEDKVFNCDIDPFVPYQNGLKLKDSVKISGDVLLNTGSYVVILNKNCIERWCGFSGRVLSTRRAWFAKYDPPGGKTYRCYYAKKQQICKVVDEDYKKFQEYI